MHLGPAAIVIPDKSREVEILPTDWCKITVRRSMQLQPRGMWGAMVGRMRMIPLGAGRLDQASSMASQRCGQDLEHQLERYRLLSATTIKA